MKLTEKILNTLNKASGTMKGGIQFNNDTEIRLRKSVAKIENRKG